MLAKESTEVFDSKEWLYEIKWDGYRAIAELSSNEIKLYSRNGNDFSQNYLVVIEELKKLDHEAIFDGEIVVLNENGFPDFQKIQHYEDNTDFPLCYYVFDLLMLDGNDIKHLPLTDRKELLKNLLPKNEVIRFSDHVSETGKDFFNAAVQNNLEGIMAKKADGEYYEGKRSNEWLKIKNHKTADVIIAGYTEPTGSRKYFGSLVLAIMKNKKLFHVGHAGTGYDAEKLKAIHTMLQPFIIKESPFEEKVEVNNKVTWVKPTIVVEVKFTEWTKDEKLRHPVFLQIRKDKNVTQITMQAQQPVKSILKKGNKKMPIQSKDPAIKENSTVKVGKIIVPITNPDKIYFPKDKVTKKMVVDYYQSIAEYILPFLKDRPQSLKRNPNGIDDEGFYHKDAGENAPGFVKSFPVYSESSKKEIDYIICNDKATLAYLNNLGCIELNPWHSTIKSSDKPDYMIIDIDPSEKNSFDQVVEAANAFEEIFDKAGAKSFCKTSGATGLHIYVPMKKKYTYDEVKDFAHLICMLVQEMLPDFTTLERNLKKRGNKKIYLDYLQNRSGQTISSVYSLRPKNGATVSMPLHWKEVKKGLTPQQFTIFNAKEIIEKRADIFKAVFGAGVNIETCLKKLNV